VGDILAVERDRGDMMAVVGTEGVITTVTGRGIIPVGTEGGVTDIIPVVIGGALGAMLIQIGGGLIRLSTYIPILIPMICLHRRAP
jgi:hypothetical protein